MLRVYFSGLVLCAFLAPAFAEDTKPEISEIMSKVNAKKSGLHGKLVEGLKAAKPSWDELAKQSKEYKKLADWLGKNDPPQGDKASWTSLTKEYADNVKKVDDAIGKKEKDAAAKGLTTISNSCAACHKEHKP